MLAFGPGEQHRLDRPTARLSNNSPQMDQRAYAKAYSNPWSCDNVVDDRNWTPWQSARSSLLSVLIGPVLEVPGPKAMLEAEFAQSPQEPI